MNKTLPVVATLGALWGAGLAIAQVPSASPPPVANLKQLMLDLIHPSANDIFLLVYRGGPQDEKDWASARRNALTLAESGNALMQKNRALDQNDWMKLAGLLADAGTAAYKAAQAKDAKGLAAAAEQLDATCNACHIQYRPKIFPPERGLK